MTYTTRVKEEIAKTVANENEKICELREKLNDSIINGEDYSVIYKISVELDELIAQYYNCNNNKKVIDSV